MSILIKGMEMPKCCGDCPIGDSLCCSLMPGDPALWKEYTISVRTNRRHEDCPLIPVPPHGRLIDADELAATCDEPHWCAWLSDIDNAPTIIPAEPPKEKALAGPYDLLYEEGGANTT